MVSMLGTGGMITSCGDTNAHLTNLLYPRAAVFILLAASGLGPICHVFFRDGVTALERFSLESLCVTCMSYAVGTIVYVSRFPEKFWPQKFDLFVRVSSFSHASTDSPAQGSSHQIFHILVAMGQIVHLYGLRDSLIRCYLDEVLHSASSRA